MRAGGTRLSWMAFLKPSSWASVGSSPSRSNQRDFHERALLGQLLDRIAAIAQDALVAVDVGDLAATGRRVDERRVVVPSPTGSSPALILARSAERIVSAWIGRS